MKIGRKKEVWLPQGWGIPGGTPPGWTVLRCGAGPQLPVQTGTVVRISIPEGVSTPMMWTRVRERKMEEGVVGLVVLPVNQPQLTWNSERDIRRQGGREIYKI